MCGIAGVASKSVRVGSALLVHMRDTMRHRGPDDSGLWIDESGCIGLGHVRLAIIDLSPAGHQPMTDRSGRLHISFNGEIYNYCELRRELEGQGHRFQTNSDTEVILEAYRAWDTECLSRFTGMFAFALHDLDRQRLFLARDRAGEKPLFYRHVGEKLTFASELKALMTDPAMPRELNFQALNYYLAFGYVPHDLCILRGVHKLPQGHAITYQLDTDHLRIWQYWKLPDVTPPEAADEDLVDELDGLLQGAVKRQLVADVPVGILLSGGVDSSLVTAMAARVSGKPVRTFTICFPDGGVSNEAPYARMVAEHFGTEHSELPAQAATVELLPQMARQFDEPNADSSMIPTYLVSRLVRQHATVALGGDGGDELFGGYLHYSWIQSLARYKRFVPASARALVGNWSTRKLPIGFRARNQLMGVAKYVGHSIAYVNTYFDAYTRARLLTPAAGAMASNGISPQCFKMGLLPDSTPLRQATALDFMTYMVDDILTKVDRASMLTSLEVRAPFLDHHLIEFAFGRVPDRLRATRTERKILLRRLGARLLPKNLDLRRKQGFSLPLDKWFAGEWGTFMRSVLSEADPCLFDCGMIEKLFEGQRKGRSNMQRLFALTMFELWRREYKITVV